MNDTISVLCPTRERPGLLACSIRMLLHQAARPERVEILIAVDDDDPTDYREVWNRFAARGSPATRGAILRTPRKHYESLNDYYNALARKASGRWCTLHNDDALIVTPHWDLILDAIPGADGPLVAMTESNHGRSPCTFPFFTKSFVDTIGHVSLSNHNDTWIEEVGKGAGIAVDVPILVLHAMIEDTVATEGKANIAKTSAKFYSPELTAARAEDVRKLKEKIACAQQ